MSGRRARRRIVCWWGAHELDMIGYPSVTQKTNVLTLLSKTASIPSIQRMRDAQSIEARACGGNQAGTRTAHRTLVILNSCCAGRFME